GTTASGGTTGSGGTTASGGTTCSGGTSGASLPACITKASQIVLVGDSYITGFGSPQLQKDALVPKLAAAVGWRNYAVAGISMATGGLFNTSNPPGFIPLEFDDTTKASLDVLGASGDAPPTTSPVTKGVLQDDPDVKLVIMTGGGNDFLLQDATTIPFLGSSCVDETNNSKDPVCQGIVSKALTAATTLMTHAANSGVKDVIYYFYPHLPGGGLGGSNPNELLDYAYPLAKSLCDSAITTTGGKLNCHFVDLRTPFKNAGGDGNTANFAGDDVHPSQAGQNIIATQILGEMQNECLGQAASSGCCAE
ncbi:MAG TPA: SGNH/GDSL hydrolase family protein, partial [Polyangiaceae bacterium]|nr:SGNH/GDSL hydrolase family protein [Polyangiaceae bacterium]